jgi:hypothetical protein
MPMAATCGVSGARRESARRMAEQFGRPVEEDRSPIQYRDTYPFFDALELDTAGNLWVRVPAPAGAGGATMPRTWQVFDADGAWLGAVETPAGLRVTEKCPMKLTLLLWRPKIRVSTTGDTDE